MDRRIDADIARAQFRRIVDIAVRDNARFVVDQKGEPAVVIMSIRDFIRTAAPPPDWLEKTWAEAKRRGADQMTLDEIDEEIDDARRDGRGSSHRSRL